jgi:hypothetical protein
MMFNVLLFVELVAVGVLWRASNLDMEAKLALLSPYKSLVAFALTSSADDNKIITVNPWL